MTFKGALCFLEFDSGFLPEQYFSNLLYSSIKSVGMGVLVETICNCFIQSTENRTKSFRFLEESSKSIGIKDYDTSNKYKAAEHLLVLVQEVQKRKQCFVQEVV